MGSWVLVFTLLQWGKPNQIIGYETKSACMEAGSTLAEIFKDQSGISYYCYSADQQKEK